MMSRPVVGCGGTYRMSDITPDVGGRDRYVTLNNGVQMPTIGFGVYRIPPDQTEHAVTDALAVGHRHIDTAASYGNEEAVGRVVAGRDTLIAR
jgi:diketogulonate reductase-like aldo/keto reductase